jgi:hypothetical protein
MTAEQENGVSGEDKNITSNADRVKFVSPKAKKIVSGHSGSILSQPDPVTLIDPALKEKVISEFRSSGQTLLNKSALPDLMIKCGFDYELQVVTDTVNQFLAGAEDFDESEIIKFAERFHAPEYYYGQRLRRNAGRGQVPEVISLLVRNCEVNTGDGEGLTSLHYASEFNQAKVIKAIMSTVPVNKVIIDCQDKYGWTPLYCAAHHGHLEIVSLLLSLGAKPTVKNAVGKSVLHAACAQNRVAIVDCILQSVLPASPSSKRSSRASASNNNAVLTAEAALLNAQDSRGMTPVHEAAYRGHTGLYQVLCKNPSADLSIRDAMGYSAADYMSDFAVPVAKSEGALPVPPPLASDVTSKSASSKRSSQK